MCGGSRIPHPGEQLPFQTVTLTKKEKWFCSNELEPAVDRSLGKV